MAKNKKVKVSRVEKRKKRKIRQNLRPEVVAVVQVRQAVCHLTQGEKWKEMRNERKRRN